MSSWLQMQTETFAIAKANRSLRSCQSINWKVCQQPYKRTFSFSKINYNFPHFQQSPFLLSYRYLPSLSPLSFSPLFSLFCHFISLYFHLIPPFILFNFPPFFPLSLQLNNLISEIQSLYQCQKISIKIIYFFRKSKIKLYLCKANLFCNPDSES